MVLICTGARKKMDRGIQRLEATGDRVFKKWAVLCGR
jgi:hypothetical protein